MSQARGYLAEATPFPDESALGTAVATGIPKIMFDFMSLKMSGGIVEIRFTRRGDQTPMPAGQTMGAIDLDLPLGRRVMQPNFVGAGTSFFCRSDFYNSF